jgi:hypothetical protein
MLSLIALTGLISYFAPGVSFELNVALSVKLLHSSFLYLLKFVSLRHCPPRCMLISISFFLFYIVVVCTRPWSFCSQTLFFNLIIKSDSISLLKFPSIRRFSPVCELAVFIWRGHEFFKLSEFINKVSFL